MGGVFLPLIFWCLKMGENGGFRMLHLVGFNTDVKTPLHPHPILLPIPDILCQTSRMNRLLILPVLLLTLLVGNPAVSADLQKGLDAAQKGDFATALKEWKLTAEQGYVSAQSNLGRMYEKGRGVLQDYKTAVKWWKLAAEQGHASAQTNLGTMYDDGQGVLQDYIRAHIWFNIAASSGESKKASENRDIVAKRMTTSQIETAQKLARECVKKNYKGC